MTNQASIPKVGMRVTISRMRQREKKSPAIIVAVGRIEVGCASFEEETSRVVYEDPVYAITICGCA